MTMSQDMRLFSDMNYAPLAKALSAECVDIGSMAPDEA